MKYFTEFPTTNYQFPDGTVLESMYIFARPDLKIQDNQGYNSAGVQYVVEDGKTPDQVSKELYATPEYFWSLLNSNNIIDVYKQWPVSYSNWLEELVEVSGDYAFFTRYTMDIKPGDYVAKKIDGFVSFDKKNFGIVLNVDKFLHSFDVKMVAGEINEGDSYIIIRPQNNSYSIINTPNGEESQVLIKKTNKVDGAVSFMKMDDYTKEMVTISAYYSITDGKLISDQTVDIYTEPTSILYLYMTNGLSAYPNIKPVSFKQDKEKEWIFNKQLTVIPNGYLQQVNDNYLSSILKESESLA
jgi:hypothetical protein